ncbi:MAG: alpha/beta fold hydrolase [Chloroflexi bacterium]|nr:alpha/beta fold hydrolase [Chloroflexota bacterium]
MPQSLIHNPHLEGDAFFWPGGPDGVLLIHGYTATTAEVRPLARFLHEKGFAVSGPLLPGHGTTPEDANRYKWRDWVRTVEAAYRELASRGQRVIVGGESTGAVLTLRLAAEHPEIAAILAYAPALRLTLRPFDAVRLRLIAPFVAYLPKGAMSNADLWKGYPVNPLKGAVELLNLQRATRPLLPKITQPILVMQGRLDTTIHASAPQEIYDGVRSTVKELHWMEQSVHTLIIGAERQQAFEITQRFIEKALG